MVVVVENAVVVIVVAAVKVARAACRGFAAAALDMAVVDMVAAVTNGAAVGDLAEQLADDKVFVVVVVAHYTIAVVGYTIAVAAVAVAT